jgi:hypothetical protein
MRYSDQYFVEAIAQRKIWLREQRKKVKMLNQRYKDKRVHFLLFTYTIRYITFYNDRFYIHCYKKRGLNKKTTDEFYLELEKYFGIERFRILWR